MENRKIAVCTTFSNEMWDVCAAEMLSSFVQYWPKDVKICIQVDPQPSESFKEINNKIIDVVGEERCFIASLWEDDQIAFVERWKSHQPKSYMDDVLRFSHKVFALEKCADATKDDIDILIWLDADVITKKPVTHEWLNEVLPGEDEVCSYLGRPGLYSECGWVAYNLKKGGYGLLNMMRNSYTTDAFASNEKGWTDCHVFDFWRTEPSKNLSPFYEHGKTPIDVWPASKLGECMEHRKGLRKHKAAPKAKAQSSVIDANNLQIKTKNCLDHKKICENVNKNLSQIRAWATLCSEPYNALYGNAQELIIASAGPSLAEHINEIKDRLSRGAKLIAVKHAIETLKAHNIKPWGVVLLDPRPHVEAFVTAPDTDVVYFVASMCDPSVVATLNKHRCKVIGYHAVVAAGEMELLNSHDLPVSGGSATATRAISLFGDMFGYKTFHLYGYDLCYPQKPDLTEMQDGKPKYMEVNIGTHSHGGKYLTRTFWTEGQFLAQSNELANLYKTRKDFTINLYGDGMAAWLHRHHQAWEAYKLEYNERLQRNRKGSPTLDEYIHAVTRGQAIANGQ